MIINDDEAKKRLNSPMNLINRLAASRQNSKAKTAMSLFIPPKKTDMEQKQTEPTKRQTDTLPFQPEPQSVLDEILQNNEAQINLGIAHDKALELLKNSVNLLSAKLDDVKADKLPAVVMSASKVVESIRKERAEASKNNKDREVHYHFYTPLQNTIKDYEVIEVQ